MEYRNKKKQKTHSKTKANFLSDILFCWVLPLILKGLKHEFDEDDLYAPLEEYDSKRLGDELEELWREEEIRKHPSLTRALAKMFGFEIFLTGILLSPFELLIVIMGPICLKEIVDYYTPSQTENTKSKACLYAGLYTPTSHYFTYKENNESEQQKLRIFIKNLCVKWDISLNDVLNNSTFSAVNGELIGVIGPTGSGKSTLLHAILKENIITKGTLSVKGVISYESQEPWIFSGSVQQNILFGQEMNPEKYLTVLKVCALEYDLSMFPFGDRTLVGERGVVLSGGQKARISLARAIYKNADIYLLDDPLSAVDTCVGMQIFNECIMTYLKSKCIVLVTHQLQYLENCQKIYSLKSGKLKLFENLKKCIT